MERRKIKRIIEKEPSTGGKAVRGLGYVLLAIGVLVLLATFTIGIARNLSVLVLVTPVPFIVFCLLLMRVGRTKKEEITEEVFTTDEEQKGGEEERK